MALLLNNSLYSVPVDFACVKAGINRVPLNARLSLNEHRKMLEETGCELLLYGADLSERASELRDALPTLQCHGIGSTDGGGDDLLADAAGQSSANPDVAVEPDDVILTLFTSGTTGTLKPPNTPRPPTPASARTCCSTWSPSSRTMPCCTPPR